MDQKAKRTWISIVIAIVIVVGIMAVTVVGGTFYFFTRHIHTQMTPSADAAQEFAEARHRFAGQPPLIELRHGDEPVLHRDLIPPSGSAAKLDTLRVLAYDTHGGKMVHVSIPFWLLRLAPSKNFSLMNNGVDFDSDRVHLSVEDLERRGPGLILDTADRRGSQVLVWTE
jgi:hypothetical protein